MIKLCQKTDIMKIEHVNLSQNCKNLFNFLYIRAGDIEGPILLVSELLVAGGKPWTWLLPERPRSSSGAKH